MTSTKIIRLLLVIITLQFVGCGGSGGDGQGTRGGGGAGGGSMIGTEHDKVMGEAMELSLKILTEVERGKDVTEVDAAFAEQLAALEARIAKLPRLKVAQTNELLYQVHRSKMHQIDAKTDAIVLKGPLPKLPDYTMYEESAINSGK